MASYLEPSTGANVYARIQEYNRHLSFLESADNGTVNWWSCLVLRRRKYFGLRTLLSLADIDERTFV